MCVVNFECQCRSLLPQRHGRRVFVYHGNSALARNDIPAYVPTHCGRATSNIDSTRTSLRANLFGRVDLEIENTMAYPSRALPSHIRSQSSSLGGSQPSGQSPALLARIAEKKAELASLKDLQVLSAGLADQMQTLAEKLSTLSDGTEGSSSSHTPTPRRGAGPHRSRVSSFGCKTQY